MCFTRYFDSRQRLRRQMSKYLDRAKRYHAGIHDILLLHRWDPIGVSDCNEARDEYDAYIGEIYGLLIRDEPRHKLIDFLWWVETEHMGLCGNRSNTEKVANLLIELRTELGDSY
jgi:hypothetical protein